MENAITVAEILDALYDGIGSTWCDGPDFIEEVEAWLESVKAYRDDDADYDDH